MAVVRLGHLGHLQLASAEPAYDQSAQPLGRQTPDAGVTAAPRRARAEFWEITPNESICWACFSAAASKSVALAGVSAPETRDHRTLALRLWRSEFC